MANDFGLRLGIEGEKAFKDALRDINQSFKVLGSEMQLVTSQFDKNDSSLRALTARNEVLNKEIDSLKDKVDALRATLENTASSFGENDLRTQNWQIQLNKAQAELNGMERELTDNEKALENVGDEFTETANDSDKFGDQIQDSGKQADDAGNCFEKLSGVLKGFGVAMGVAFAAIGTAANAYKTLSVAVTDSNGHLRDAETVYWEAIDALGNVANETERDALAMQIFGKSARDLNPLIAQGSAGIAALTDEARSMGAVMSGEALVRTGQV